MEPLNGDFIRNQVHLLREEGYVMDLVYADLNIRYLKNLQLTSGYHLQSDRNGNVDFIISGPFWPKNNIPGFRRWIRKYVQWIEIYFKMRGMPDIIHAHTYLGGIVSSIIKEKYHIPFLVTEHYTGWMDRSISAYHHKVGIESFQNADVITAVSTALQQCLKKKISKEVEVISNFIDTKLFKSSVRKSGDEFSAICIGDLIPRKQVDHAIKSISRLSSKIKLKLAIVGTGPEEGYLKSLVKDLKLESQVFFFGQLRKWEVASLLAKSDVLLHPSKMETFGIVIAEALCCGLPVISYDNSGIQEMSKLPGVHIVQDQELNSFAQMIEYTSNIKQNRQEISLKAQNQLGVKATTHSLDKIYETLLIQDIKRKKEIVR